VRIAFSRISVAQPQNYKPRGLPGSPCTWHGYVHIAMVNVSTKNRQNRNAILVLSFSAPRALHVGASGILLLRNLAFTRYWFASRRMSVCMCTNQWYSLQTPPLFGHPTLPLYRTHYCAIYCFPSTPRDCNIYHTILWMTISVKANSQPVVCVWYTTLSFGRQVAAALQRRAFFRFRTRARNGPCCFFVHCSNIYVLNSACVNAVYHFYFLTAYFFCWRSEDPHSSERMDAVIGCPSYLCFSSDISCNTDIHSWWNVVERCEPRTADIYENRRPVLRKSNNFSRRLQPSKPKLTSAARCSFVPRSSFFYFVGPHRFWAHGSPPSPRVSCVDSYASYLLLMSCVHTAFSALALRVKIHITYQLEVQLVVLL